MAHQLLSGTGGTKCVQCHGPLIAEWDWRYENLSNVMAHRLLSGTGGTKRVKCHGSLIAYFASWIFDTKSTCLHHLRNVIRGCWSSYTSYDPWQCFVTFSPANHHSENLDSQFEMKSIEQFTTKVPDFKGLIHFESLLSSACWTNLFCLWDKESFEKASPIKRFEAILVIFNPFIDVPAWTLCARQQNLKSFSLQHAEGLASKQ